MKSILEFDAYKVYLIALERSRQPIQRGFRSRVAEHLGCQNAFVSQVLNGSAHFSPDQGIRLAKFLKLGADETEYFMFMLESNRAGTKELKDYCSERMAEIRTKLLDISNRVEASNQLSDVIKDKYYSQWYYSAIYVLTSIPKYRTLDSLCEALDLSKSTVETAVLDLLSWGLLVEKNKTLHSVAAQLHLSQNSPNILRHHTNWRIQAIRFLDEVKDSDVHYSTVSSLSEVDALKLKSQIVEFIRNYTNTVSPSKEETAFAFGIDFYKLIKS